MHMLNLLVTLIQKVIQPHSKNPPIRLTHLKDLAITIRPNAQNPYVRVSLTFSPNYFNRIC